MGVEIIKKYFTALSQQQSEQFAALFDLYSEWNAKINVVSRKDIDNLYTNHVLHSLAIAKYTHFTPNSIVVDVGTGGGFPGIPLAIFFPEVHFTLLDSIGKKVRVAREVATAIDLQNVDFVHARMEEEKRKFDFVVSRAVMPLPDLVKITHKNIAKAQQNSLPNGLICLKGGELSAELAPFKNSVETLSLDNYFEEPFFATKKIIYLPL